MVEMGVEMWEVACRNVYKSMVYWCWPFFGVQKLGYARFFAEFLSTLHSRHERFIEDG